MIITIVGDIQEMIDFTECKIDLTANYGGSDQKRGILYQGQRYMSVTLVMGGKEIDILALDRDTKFIVVFEKNWFIMPDFMEGGNCCGR